MPTARGSAVLCDMIDLTGESGRDLIAVVIDVMRDGEITPAERRLVDVAAAEHRAHLESLPGPAADLDIAIAGAGALLGAGAVTDYAYRRVREAYEDRRDRMRSVAEPVASVA